LPSRRKKQNEGEQESSLALGLVSGPSQPFTFWRIYLSLILLFTVKMIRTIAFDLDGVLFDGCDLHANLFLTAVSRIRPDLGLTKEYHDTHFNGLPTKTKLKLLGISDDESQKISSLKQELTSSHLLTLTPSSKHIELCEELTRLGFRIFCVSNSIHSTIHTVLSQMGILHLFSGIVSNEDVSEAKPSPMPYLRLFEQHGIHPDECLIVEDSEFGILSATRSGAFVLCVRNCDDVTLSTILGTVEKIKIDSSIKKHLAYS
jgi:beta-phosphoglucomutase-like phosphatase (HAD superfamily)